MLNQLKISVLMAILSTFLVSTAWSAQVSEAAQRHFDRGMAAVEMAKTPDDYDAAIREFKQARDLAPDWPDVYYNLGLIQDKAGKYKDAVDSLRNYLRMSPNAPEAQTIRSMINRDEFKAEQALSDDDVLNILVSLTDKSRWQIKPITNNDNLHIDDAWGTIKSISRIPGQPTSLKFIFRSGCSYNNYNRQSGMIFDDAMLSGKSMVAQTWTCRCLPSADSEECFMPQKYFLEVQSRDKVKMRTILVLPQKFFGGGTREGVFEFVRR